MGWCLRGTGFIKQTTRIRESEMRIPKSIKVSGMTYKIRKVKTLYDGEHNGLMGQCNSVTKEIFICTTVNDLKVCGDEMYSTFIHEVLEAINHEYNMNLEHDKIEELERAIKQVMLDNCGEVGK